MEITGRNILFYIVARQIIFLIIQKKRIPQTFQSVPKAKTCTLPVCISLFTSVRLICGISDDTLLRIRFYISGKLSSGRSNPLRYLLR